MTPADRLTLACCRVEKARAVLAKAYAERTAAACAARKSGMSVTAIAAALGVVRPAVRKILAGQDGMPARQGPRWDRNRGFTTGSRQ